MASFAKIPAMMLLTLALLACLGFVSAKPSCPPQQFMSEFFGKCINCTECHHPDATIRPCESTRDTLCGPLSMLKLDWSWMKHDTENTVEPVKEMTETFHENLEQIKLHEMHVKQMQRLLKGHGGEEGKLELWDNLKALGREKDKSPEIAEDLVESLKKPNVLSQNPKIFEIPLESDKMHFNSEEASYMLKTASDSSEDDSLSPHKLKFNHELLVKNFGFFPVDENSDENYDDDSTDDPKDNEPEAVTTFSEKVVLDYQTGIVFFALATIFIFFILLLSYCCKICKRQYAEDLADFQFWPKKNQKWGKSVPSTIYKTTTEVIGKESSGNYKYLERIISKAAKKNISRVPSKIYLAARPSLETRPLTADWKVDVHKTKSEPPTV